MAKNNPIETRTSRIAYCSKSLLPKSADWTNRFQSISFPSSDGCPLTKPRIANSPASRLCVHPFDPWRAKCGSHEWIRKVLCFMCNLVTRELHDAHGIGRLAVICQDVFGNPKTTAANDSLHGKPLNARLTSALALYVPPPASSLPRLRIIQHRILAIDEVLRFKIVGIGRHPMLIQCRMDLLISHSGILLRLWLILHLEPA